MSRVFDLMIMNLIFIFTSIPIFTIGVNYTALYYVTLKMVKNEESYVFKSYWKSWRQNFKQATGIWLIFLFIGVFLVMDIFLVNQMTGPSTYLRYVFFVILFIWGMVLTYVFPVLSRFDNTVKQTIKNSLLMSIRHLPWTIVMLVINLLPLILLIFAPTTVASLVSFVMIFLGIAVVAYANSWFFVNKIFPYYMPSEEEEELSELEESSRVLEAMDRATPDFLENSGNPTTESVDAASEAEPSADETETDGTEENTVSGKDSSSAGSESETE
ncbi:MAG TPA: DUF624 domain-containing protein [Candidatus Fusicatenibacter merdavium]|uniref:DUF624 domain-containing protein n=1 Tax=Candidatus Fusicatenibacter merdavium TaxID=2838600 RepID=A0A9D1XEQ0_9FIRM|nr:DUF624 domain-containing protein [Candidatus Fusicatenibacter merdavium]